MELQNIQNSIEREFAAFMADVEIKNRSGKFDINIVGETFFIDILNVIYSCSLHNANLDKKNQDGFDLIDNNEKIIIQVTSTNSLEKLKKSIKSCNAPKFTDFQYIFLLISKSATELKLSYSRWIDKCKKSSKSKKENMEKEEDKLDILNVCFYPNITIIDIPEIINRINKSITDPEELKKIELYVIKSLRYFRQLDTYETELAEVVSILGNEFNENKRERDIPPIFKIRDKIAYNHISDGYDEMIMRNVKYTAFLNEIYDNYNRAGKQISHIILHKLFRFYLELQKEGGGATLFRAIVDKTVEYVRNSKNCAINQEDRLDFAVTIVVVDAFIRCGIFMHPDNDSTY